MKALFLRVYTISNSGITPYQIQELHHTILGFILLCENEHLYIFEIHQ